MADTPSFICQSLVFDIGDQDAGNNDDGKATIVAWATLKQPMRLPENIKLSAYNYTWPDEL